MASTIVMVLLMVMLIICSIKLASAQLCEEIILRQKEVSVYYHDTMNVTEVLVAQPPSRPGPVHLGDAPFGTLFFINDLVTEGPDPASPLLGSLIGSSYNSALDYGSDMMMSLVLNFVNNSSPSNPQLQGLHGTLIVSGVNSMFFRQPQPITGGTGSFAFVLGSLTMVPVDISTATNAVLRLDLLLFWPPYSS